MENEYSLKRSRFLNILGWVFFFCTFLSLYVNAKFFPLEMVYSFKAVQLSLALAFVSFSSSIFINRKERSVFMIIFGVLFFVAGIMTFYDIVIN
ncbi:MAG: hypothetical protein O2809_06250 [Proteobacteria bacterium]|nr:hypothetical protein [Pseudomonadota bacterium]